MRRSFIAILLVSSCFAAPAHAFIEPGETAPDFTKNELVGGSLGPSWNYYGQTPRVTILFVLGYN